MILAVSRFRVANGLQAAVSDAFLHRPGLVDASPGFLGLETYTDAADASTFWLVTHWTDAPSFQAWHHSEAHHASHGAMPRGLKLDASATSLSVLDRIEAPAGPTFAEALRDDAALLSAHVSTSEYVYWLLATLDGTVRHCSGAFVRDCGPGVVGRALTSLMPPSDAAVLRGLVAAGCRHGEPVLLNFLDTAGNPFSLRCRVDVRPGGLSLLGEPVRRHEEALADELARLNNELAVLAREDARKARALALALSELREAQSLLVHREKMASLGQMTAGVAHEINTPLGYVMSHQETLARDITDLAAAAEAMRALVSTHPEHAARLQAIEEEADLEYLRESIPRRLRSSQEGLARIQQLVLDMRTFSRLDEADEKPCDPAETVAASLRFLRPLATERDVTIDMRLAALAPLRCHPGALNQAVANVVANAIQASPPGGRVEVALFESDGDVVVAISDRGAGIAPEHLPRIFDPFFTTKAVGAGTGLGLSIAHQVLKAHGGRIEVDSVLSEGTTVRLRIPVHGRR
jgi:two-component system, NtrC family, sensor kinase